MGLSVSMCRLVIGILIVLMSTTMKKRFSFCLLLNIILYMEFINSVAGRSSI